LLLSLWTAAGTSTEARNLKKTLLHRSAASKTGPWPEPSNISIATRPPFFRYCSRTLRIWVTMGWGGNTSSPGQPGT